uniref:3-hydroxyacyl-CoA dehydrogenase NAD-binding domain-containing protein n=1 Tax=Glaesserella sp. TaxID=2094731 RepID=UPI0035A05C99
MSEVNTIAVIGLGYIGLPTAVAFATAGKRVLGVDINPSVVESVNQGQVHIIEPGLNDAVEQVVK